jgi:hypothetical protein
MSRDIVDKVVRSVLYEGYMLYPYRRSALKNQHRWNFGLIYPEGMEPSRMQTECLLAGGLDDEIVCEVRFLQIHENESWQETTERSVSALNPGTHPFDFETVRGDVRMERECLETGLQKIRITITNRSPLDRHCDALPQTFVSTHTILTARSGQFISLLDPPDHFRETAAKCRNIGTWPVLIGKEPDRSCILSSPIVLYDYPRVADESPDDLFDCTEIDEILTLRILSLTEAEKEEVRRSGGRERRLLEHVESLTPEQLMKLHGIMRAVRDARAVRDVRDARPGFKPGDRVRLRPKPGGDVFDVVLAGRAAIVESVETDFENRIHVAVVIEDDPGKDLGLMRQPGHRFFFSADELEALS